MKIIINISLLFLVFVFNMPGYALAYPIKDTAPKIVNIVNFIRQSEPRSAAVTEEVLIETVMELKTAPGIKLPFNSIGDRKITATLNDFKYTMSCTKGTVQKAGNNESFVFRLVPESNKLVLNCHTKSLQSTL